MIEIETHDRVPPIAREWDQLAERLGASPFLRPGWIAAWGDAFAPAGLTVVAARRHGEVRGVVPLCRRRGELRSASNEHSPEFGFLAADEDTAAELARLIYGEKNTTICLDFIDPNDIGLRECREAATQAGYRTVERPRLRSPYLEIEGDWRDCASPSTRREAERRLRRLGETGGVIFEIADGSERLDDLLEEGFRVEASGWKGKSGSAIAFRAETRAFYAGIARWAAERGWLRLAFLRLDGRPLAFVLGLETEGVFYSVKSGFDPGYRRFGAGGLLRYQLLARAFSAGLSRYEFLGDAEPWKLEWTATCRDRRVFRAFAPSTAGTLQWALRGPVYRVARRMPFAKMSRRLFRK